jgi:hypothetical protein
MTSVDFKFKHPSTFLISGPTQCGKSTFVKALIKNIEKLFDHKVNEIIYCLPYNQSIENIENVTFLEGLPSTEIFNDRISRVLVLDDLMNHQDKTFIDLFTRISHHNNVSVIYINQNLFSNRKGTRDISLNSHYIILFKNPRDKNQIQYLARQVFPENPKYMQEAYIDATSKPHGYILLDLTQATKDELRIRTNILPTDIPQNIIYVPLGYKRYELLKYYLISLPCLNV